MVERFSSSFEEVLHSRHIRSGEELEMTLHRYVWLCNEQLAQLAPGSRTPSQAVKDWYKPKPQLFQEKAILPAGK